MVMEQMSWMRGRMGEGGRDGFDDALIYSGFAFLVILFKMLPSFRSLFRCFFWGFLKQIQDMQWGGCLLGSGEAQWCSLWKGLA